jgi:hypothetical protein
MKHRFLCSALGLVLISLTTGCRIQVDKSKSGEDKNVKIDTPMGGLHVRTDELSAADLGLPTYPGAQLVSDHGKDHDKQSADIHVGFGKWQLRVKVVSYQAPDSQDKVLSFYRKALGRYGDVLQCDNGQAIGSPTTTREGLTCSDSSGHNAHVNDDDKGLNLRAGSRHHQHIVQIKKSDSNGTRFSMVELELPQDNDDSSAESQ